MRALIINTACAALLLGGCASKSSTSLVVVTVDSDTVLSDVATLHARVTLGEQTREFDVHPTNGSTLSVPPAQNFGIDIPRNMTGTLAVHVEAQDSSGDTTATGDGTGPIRLGARADISVQLTATTATGDNDLGPSTGGDMALPTGDMVVVPPAMLTIDKTMQSFGDITVGKTSTTTSFLVTNAGGMPSSVATLTPGGTNVSEFTIDTDCGPSLMPGGRCHVTASVTPTSAGPKMASFTLMAASGGSVGGSLTANALTPGAVKIVQPSGDCGSSLIGTQSTTAASFTVQNTGASPTSTLSVGTSDSQFVATGCGGMTLAAGAMCTVTVKFTPTASGTQNASLTVSATTGGSDTASLVGVGLKPASLRVTPASYAFAATPRLSTMGPTQTFTVTNDGDVPSPTLALATITGSGANAQSFVIANDGCQGKQVGPAPSSCAINVRFAPQATGLNSATLNINTSTATALMVPLTGTGSPIWVQEAADLTLPSLHAVWAADAGHVYAVGDTGTIVYRDPTSKWSVRTLSTSTPLPNLVSVSGASSTNVDVAGGGIFNSTNSSTWTPWEAGKFSSVVVFDASDIWGSYYYLDTSGSEVSAVYRTQPSGGWSQVLGTNGDAAPGLGHLWGSSPTDVYSYGGTLQCAFGSCSSNAIISHTDSTGNWVAQYSANLPNPLASVTSMWGFGKPANNIYAVATTSTTPLHSTGNGTWTALGGSAPHGCSAVWGADAAHVWFGCGQSLWAFDGNTWTETPIGFSVGGIFGSGSGDVYAVGTDSNQDGLIYHYY